MKTQVAQMLKKKAEEVAELYSHPEREKNVMKDVFSITQIAPLSEHSACVVYHKSITDKVVCMFFYYIEPYNEWRYFCPNDSHILGMNQFAEQKFKAEQWNYDKNFPNGGGY